jgi:hypothetical protein
MGGKNDDLTHSIERERERERSTLLSSSLHRARRRLNTSTLSSEETKTISGSEDRQVLTDEHL